MASNTSPRPLDLDQVAELLRDVAADNHLAYPRFDWAVTDRDGSKLRAAADDLALLAPLLREWVEAQTIAREYGGHPDIDERKVAEDLRRATEALLTHLTQSTPTAPGATDG